MGSWLLLGLLQLFNSYCLNIENTFKMVRYFTFTLSLTVMFSLVFNTVNGLRYYILESKTDAFNTVLSIFLNILFGLALLTIWIRTYQLTAEKLPEESRSRSVKVHHEEKMSENVIVPVPLASEENGDKMVIREKES